LKALIISDIHSNIYAVQAIWEKEKDCDRIYCAGDIVDYGPFPKESLSDYEAWINPGSVSYRSTRQSDDFSQDAHYMTITDGRISIKKIQYDLTPLFNEVNKLELNPSQIKFAYRFFQEGYNEA
jgi:predicted phosphodiesterase